jgi:hypothetical protein
MKLTGKVFVGTVYGVLCILIGTYYLAFKAQQGSPVKAEWWIKNVYDIKENHGRSVLGKKIILLSGSNALIGINSKVIEKATGLSVLNLAGHAWLDLDFLLFKLKQYIREGDIVVVPLETRYYSKSPDIVNSWFNNNMLAWGKDYLDQLNIVDYLKFLVSTPADRIFGGLIVSKNPAKIMPPNAVIEELNRLIAEKGEVWRGYSYRSMNLSGDMIPGKETTKGVLLKYGNGFNYYGSNIKISQDFLNAWKKISELVQQHQGKLILTWPTTIRRGISDLTLTENQIKTDTLKAKLEKYNINIYCNPALFNLDIRLFFNSNLHLNKDGTLIRSENLSICLKQILNDSSYKSMDYSSAIKIVREKESIYLKYGM